MPLQTPATVTATAVPKKKREPRWDNIKFVLIFLVVLGHFADYFTDTYAGFRSLFIFIYTFHMPAFIFVSGLFAKRTINQEKSPFKKVFPYLVLCVILQTFRVISLRLTISPDAGFNYSRQSNISWFLFVLFAFYIITWLLKDFRPSYVLISSVCFALVAGFDSGIGAELGASRIIVFFPFFYLGYILDRDALEEFLDKTWVKICAWIFLIALAAVCFFGEETMYLLRRLFTGQNSYQSVFGQFQPLAPLVRLGTYCLTFVSMFSVFAVIPKGRIPLISKAGANTLGVYFWHLPFCTFLCWYEPLVSRFSGSLAMLTLYSVVWSVVLTALFSLDIFSKPLNWILRGGTPAKKKVVANLAPPDENK